MAGEEKKCCDSKKTLATLFKVVFRSCVFGIRGPGNLKWWKALLLIFKGCIGLFLILAGVIYFSHS